LHHLLVAQDGKSVAGLGCVKTPAIAAHVENVSKKFCIVESIYAVWIVVCNVSRTIITAARLRYSRVAVVLVTAPAKVLAARLAARGRATDGCIDQRLKR
jgi:ribose 1,5-bisphosphokinase